MASSELIIFKQKKYQPKTKEFSNDFHPKKIIVGDGIQPVIVKTVEGLKANSSCLRCLEPRCIQYSIDEIVVEDFSSFPFDSQRNVCATDAIIWEEEDNSPKINADLCIMCGVCLSRCPVGAIYFDQQQKTAKIWDEPNELFRLIDKKVSEEEMDNLISTFDHVKREGCFLVETEEILRALKLKILEYVGKNGSQFSNILTRNLFIEIGIQASSRRLGDTNIRNDLILGQPGISLGTGEVEIGNDSLSITRKLLDDIVVLVSRYGFDKDNLVPFAICFTLPNNRSEYWQVVKDIKDVLKIKIQTITLIGLFTILWSRSKLSIKNINDLYIDIDNTSLREKIERIIDRELNLDGDASLGLFDCEK